jgi:hypothetical protein
MTEIPGLKAKLEDVTRAAIAADMKRWGFVGTCDTGFVGPKKIIDPQNPPSNDHVHVTYPDAVVTEGAYPDPTFAGRPSNDLPAAPVRLVYAKWPTQIAEAFKRYSDVPDPADFQQRAALLERIATGLDIAQPDARGSGAAQGITVGNPDLAWLVRVITSQLGGYSGDTMRNLNGFLGRLATVVPGQHAMATILTTLMDGERAVWAGMREDVYQIAEHGRAAFSDVINDAELSHKTVLKVVVTVTEVLELVTDSKAVKVVKTLAAAAERWLPEHKKTPPRAIKGSTADQVYESLLAALDNLDRAAYDQEWALAKCGRDAIAVVAATSAAFDLQVKLPSEFLDARDTDDVFTEPTELSLRTEKLRDVAGEVERVAGVLNYVRSDLQTALGSGIWDRDPAIGLGRNGHYWTYEELHADLSAVLDRSARTLSDIAEKMVLVSHDFDRTETQIENDLGGLSKDVYDPTETDAGDQWVPYGY